MPVSGVRRVTEELFSPNGRKDKIIALILDERFMLKNYTTRIWELLT